MHYVFVRVKKHWWSRAGYELRPYLTTSAAFGTCSATWVPPTAGSLLQNGRS